MRSLKVLMGGAFQGYNTVYQSQIDGFGSSGRLELLQQMTDVQFDRTFCNEQRLSYFLVALAYGHESKNLYFSNTQSRTGDTLRELGSHVRQDIGDAVVNFTNGFQQILSRGIF